jgi:hypothetical protein
MKLTPKRIQLLALVQRHPGLLARKIADEVYPRLGSEGRMIGWTRQGATRFGCAMAQPLVNCGFLRMDRHVDVGGARYFITHKGIEALQGSVETACEESTPSWPFPGSRPPQATQAISGDQS